jgi:hypothetical protein
MSKNDTTQIIAALEASIQALSVTGVDQETIDTALQALIAARNIAKQELVEKILGGLYQLEYERDHILYRVTVEDFADLLADRLVERGILPSALTREELAHLVDQAGEYLNGDGIAWVDAINIALTDAWPERFTESED